MVKICQQKYERGFKLIPDRHLYKTFSYVLKRPNLFSIILRPKKPLGSWNLVNPLLSMNEAWMDECAARLQSLVDQYKPRQHQTFAIEKIPRFDRNNPIMFWGLKSLKKNKYQRFTPLRDKDIWFRKYEFVAQFLCQT